MNPFIIGVGELIWDVFPAGKQLGGAPGNFAHHARQLGAESLLISRVGDDSLGREALAQIAGLGLRTDGITVHPTVPTGAATITLDPQGKPTFIIQAPSAWDFIEATRENLRQAARADAICFGTLGQRHPASRAAVQALVAAAPKTALRIFDLNLRQTFWTTDVILQSLRLANVVKLNDEELPVVANALGLTGDDSNQLHELADRFNLRVIALTRGAAGSVLFADGQIVSRDAAKQAVVDTVGAGDSFTAALTVGLLRGCDLAAIHKAATDISGFVCSRPGATPALPPELRAALDGNSAL
jgi:fructokinase